MTIDFHTHAFPDALAPRALSNLVDSMETRFDPFTDGTLAGLVGKMDAAGIDKSVLLPVITKQSQTKNLNEWAANAAVVSGGRVIPFGGIFPHTDDYKRDIDFVVSLGLRGLKFHCEYQNFSVDAPEFLPIYDYALSRGLVLVFHAGYDPSFPPPFKSSPRQFRAISDAMRGGTIVAAHLGGHAQWDDVEKYIVGTCIYLDTSMGQQYYPTETFMRIVRSHGADKILFATDSPWSDGADELESIRELPLSDAEKALILGENAKKLLNLQ
ncbi:MAG: amidohydrolase family protein [Oscillospiraceae bacterium]|jgi:predicted TIM-barrel fold metal-dependent hydrolase|nr:amidohydrolase family protein [Oscillospiraceae bacterium]